GVGMRLVKRIEREAAGYEAVARAAGAVAERAADELSTQRTARDDIVGELGVAQHHSSEADEIDVSFAHGRLRDVREPFLEITVSGTDDRQVWKFVFELCDHRDLARDADERVFGRQIAV